MEGETRYPSAVITSHPGGNLTTFLVEEIVHGDNEDRIKVTIDAPRNYMEINDDAKLIGCVYSKELNNKVRIVHQAKIFEEKDLKSLKVTEKKNVYMNAASRIVSALQKASETSDSFEVILKFEG